MTDHRKAMVLAAFAADSLALGAHWIYDTKEIVDRFGRVEQLLPPVPDSYHSTKKKGDFTHYGDQMLVLLRSLADKGQFDLTDFSEKWRALFADYDGYVDGATRKTLAYYEKGKPPEAAGSHTPDFAGAARIAPLVYRYANDVIALASAVRNQTMMTHNDAATLDTAEFFARVTVKVLAGTAPVQAIQNLVEDEAFEMSPVSMWVADGLKHASDDTVAAVKRFGQACETNQVFPGVIQLIAKYEDNPEDALVQAVMAGGESAARGIMTATVLAAHAGLDAIPAPWIDGMNKKDDILTLLSRLD